MIKIGRLLSIGKRVTGTSKANGKVWTKIDAKFQIVGTEQEIIAGRFHMETDDKIKEVERLSVNRVYALKIRHDSREHNGEWYYSQTVEKVSDNEVDRIEKYNKDLHYIAGTIFRVLPDRSTENGTFHNFLIVSGTGAIIKMSHYSSDESFRSELVEGADFVVGVVFSVTDYNDSSFVNIQAKTMQKLGDVATPQTVLPPVSAPISPEPVVIENDDLPF